MTEQADAYVVSFKAHTGYDSPLLTIRSGNASELQDRIDAAIGNSLFAVIADADKAFKGSYELGKQLGARPVEAPKPETSAAPAAVPEPAKAAEPEAPKAWGNVATDWPPADDPRAAESEQPAAAPAASNGFPAAPSWAKPAWA